MLGDIPSTPAESTAKKNQSDVAEIAKQVQKLATEVDPVIGPIQWIVEIENQKRRAHGWRFLAIFCIIQLSVIYLVATIFILKIIISL